MVEGERLFVDPDTRPIYDKFRKFSSLRLTNSDMFSLALTIGFRQGLKKPLKRKVAFIRHETITQNLLSIMLLIAINEFDDEEWIQNPSIILKLAEEYANAGIEIINNYLDDINFDFISFLESNIFELYDESEFKLKLEEFYLD